MIMAPCRLPSFVLKGKSPYELVFNKKTFLKHLRVFGCLCFAIILNNHDKFSSRAEKCVLIGYSSFKKGYKLFSLVRKQFIFSRDVNFFEKVFPFKVKHSSVKKTSQDLDHVNFFDEIVHEGPGTSYDDNDLNAHDQSDGGNSPKPSSPTLDLFKDDLRHHQGSNGSTNKDEMVATSGPNTALSEDDVPNSLNTKHVQNVDNQPLRRSERSSVFPNKYNEYVVDSKVKYGLERYLDINNAFLYGELHETVYMDLPEGFYSPDDKRVCKLKKSLYGLKQAPKQWNAKLTQTLTENRFKQSKSDYSLFTKFDNGNFIALLVGVHIVKQPKTSLEAFVDADWAKCLATRKSVTRFYVKLNVSLVS
nr:ribonuclease H-like domain-containing protein [Tanacetum cinerariifolium]